MPNKEIKNTLNTWDILVVSFGAMIGWGWVVSSGDWITSGGILGTIIAFLIGGLLIYFVGLVYAELTTAFPYNGGAQKFSEQAFGKNVSFICAWSLVLSYLGVVCFEAVSFPTILQYIFPHFLQGYLYTVMGFDIYLSWLIVAIFTSIFIVYINIRGAKIAAVFQTIFTSIIAIVGMTLIVGSALNGNIDNINTQLFIGNNLEEVTGNIMRVALMTPFFLFGFDVIPQAAEEIKVPLKRIGRIMMLSIIMAVTFYALIVLSVGYVMDGTMVKEATTGAGLVTASAMEVAFSSKMMAKVLVLGGLCGIVTSWNSFLIGGSRIIYSMAKTSLLPKVFSQIHNKYNTPANAILLLGIISVISVFFGRIMLIWIVNASNLACCISYCIVALSFLSIRKKYPNLSRPYRVKLGKYVGIMAVALTSCMSILFVLPGTRCSLSIEEWVIVSFWAILGIILWTRRVRQKVSSQNLAHK